MKSTTQRYQIIVYSSNNNLGNKFAPQLISTVPSPTTLFRQLRPAVTGANCHQEIYQVINLKAGSLSLPGKLKISLPCPVNVANHTDQT